MSPSVSKEQHNYNSQPTDDNIQQLKNKLLAVIITWPNATNAWQSVRCLGMMT